MSGGSILLVEDDCDVRETLAELLNECGYAVSTAEHGRHALDLLDRGLRPDVILLDLMMPVMNGLQFREQQLTRPEYAAIPIVVVSADEAARAKSNAMGASGLLIKPLKLEALLAAVRRVSSPAGA